VGKPKKASGELGLTKISGSSERPIAEYLHVELPSDKEELESYFAAPFVRAFNESRPLGHDVLIEAITQNDTSDLDFNVVCPAADYLELGELNPRSETFGRKAFQTGHFNTHEYAHWIYSKIINEKQRSYGSTSCRSFLLLYSTHWQFLTSQNVVACLRSWCVRGGVNFSGVFIMDMIGGTEPMITTIYPYSGPPLPPPKAFKKLQYWNLPPGNSSWSINALEHAE
jgi:hypothetical protein